MISLRLGYGVPPTQLAVSFISHEYHYVGMTCNGCGYGAYHNLIKFIQCVVQSTGHVVYQLVIPGIYFFCARFLLDQRRKDCKFTLTYFREGRWRAG